MKKQCGVLALLVAVCSGLPEVCFALGNARVTQYPNPTALASSSPGITSTVDSDNNPNDLPWFTGPILAGAGHTVTPYHTNIETYVFYTNAFGAYDGNWKVHRNAKKFYSLSPTLIITQGLLKFMDAQLVIPYQDNQFDGNSASNLGDLTVTLGFQALNGTPNTWIPSLRATLGETFPTGAYQNLDPNKQGTDATGTGSYQTNFGLNFQQLWNVSPENYFRGRLSLGYTVPSKVTVNGFNAFGGASDTNAKENLGNQFSADIGMEYTLNEHWVPAMDILYTENDASTFSGIAGTDVNGLPALNNGSAGAQFSFAPALEYNFNADFGIIAGVWFSAAGRNSAEFNSFVIALNYYH